MSNDKVIDKLDTLIGMVGGLDTRLAKVETRLTSVEGRMDKLEYRMEKLEESVIGLGRGQARLEGRVEEQSQILQVAIAGRITRSKPAA